MPLIFYSTLISSILTILGIQGLQHLGVVMIGTKGAAFGVVTFVVVHFGLMIAMSHKYEHRFDAENKARRLIGIPLRRN